jgi:hypothetical protein
MMIMMMVILGHHVTHILMNSDMNKAIKLFHPDPGSHDFLYSYMHCQHSFPFVFILSHTNLSYNSGESSRVAFHFTATVSNRPNIALTAD